MIIKRKQYSQAVVRAKVDKIKDLKDANNIKKVLREQKAGKPFSGNKEEVLTSIQRQRGKIKRRLSELENTMNHSDQMFNKARNLEKEER